MHDTIPQLCASPPTRMDLRRGVVLTSAAEQMFFFGAPLAHVVAYENWRREERLQQTYRRQARRSRLGLPPVFVGDRT
jgi:hypothetical protein